MGTLEDIFSENNSQGKSDKIMFFVNIGIILVHILLMLIYVYVESSFLIVINTLSIAFYVCMITTSYTNPKRYVIIAFTEVWTHMICASLCLGWNAGFQNYSFALIVACFLPAHNENRDNIYRTVPYIYSISVIFTYFLLHFLVNLFPMGSIIKVNELTSNVLFCFNTFVAFITIMGATIFYTSKSRRKEFELTRKADYDELTLLYNRYAIVHISKEIISDANKLNRNYNIAILDIDHFKKVNDKYGHNSGDIVLKEIAKILKAIYAKGIIPGRWGGEEFVLMAPSDMKYKEFHNQLIKLNQKIAATPFVIENNETIKVTVSIGCASVSPSSSIEEAVGVADERLYEAKNTGRNKVVG